MGINLLGMGTFGIVVWSVVGILGAIILTAVIVKIVVDARKKTCDTTTSSCALTGKEVAEKLLEKLNLTEVKVQKAGYFAGAFFGNYYNPNTKTIHLRAKLFDSNCVTAVSVAVQKVAMSILHKKGNKQVKFRSIVQKIVSFAPYLVVPILILGIVLDATLNNTLGIVSVITVCIVAVYYFAALILMLASFRVEKQANKLALEILEQTNLLNDGERELINNLYKTSAIAAASEFIISMLYILYFILRLIWIPLSKAGK